MYEYYYSAQLLLFCSRKKFYISSNFSSFPAIRINKFFLNCKNKTYLPPSPHPTRRFSRKQEMFRRLFHFYTSLQFVPILQAIPAHFPSFTIPPQKHLAALKVKWPILWYSRPCNCTQKEIYRSRHVLYLERRNRSPATFVRNFVPQDTRTLSRSLCSFS
jgi:hypothetical protein